MTALHARAGAAAVVVALAAATVAAAPASAASTRPARASFALTSSDSASPPLVRAAPGTVVRRAVRVTNLTGRRITVKLRAADVRNATNGNADYKTSRVSRTGRWIRLTRSTIRLRPHTSRRASFRVRIPASARGASHYAGIVAANAAELAAARPSKRSKRNAFRIARVNRQALPITIRLPGPITRRLTLRSIGIDVTSAGAGLVLALRPRGNILIRDAPISLRVSRDGRRVFDHAAIIGQVFPGTALRYRIPWRAKPTEGRYRVAGVIRPRNAPVVRFERIVRFTAPAAERLQHAMPASQPTGAGLPPWVWLALGGATVLLLALSATIWKLSRRPLATVPYPGRHV